MKEPIKLRTVFMGTSDFAAVILEDLIGAGYDIISVYTQEDKKIGRKQELQKSAVKMVAENNKVVVLEPKKFDTETIAELKKQNTDLIIVAAYGKILPQEVLDIPGFGALNIHPSLLPKFRGPSPIQNALLAGEKETGSTLILMNAGIDAGDILAQKKTPIEKNETYPELLSRLAELSSAILLETLPLWVERKIQPQKQDDGQASYCQLIERSDGQIIWADEAVSIYDHYRAFFLWPGIFTFWEKDGFKLRLKLLKISLDNQSSADDRKLGQVFRLGDKIAAQTSAGAIILEEVQLEGKNSLKINDFIIGYPDFIGSILE
jgi:methionyl-tRNA formyltransferase